MRSTSFTRTPALAAIIAAGLAAGASVSHGQTINANYSRPALDRWMYPFNSQAGTEAVSPIFGAILIDGFDDRDAQFIVAFDTAPAIPAGRPPQEYRIEAFTLTAFVVNSNEVVYDHTFDTVFSLLPSGDPQFVSDADAGRPTELFGVGFRGGFTAATFTEDAPFGGAPVVPPAEGNRHAFAAASFNELGEGTDLSRQVRQRFDAQPWAIGTNPALTPGQLIPGGTALTFSIDPCNAQAREYLRRGLASGRVFLSLSSLVPASQPGGDPLPRTYPVIGTKEGNPATRARLAVTVRVGDPADFNGDGFVDFFDFDEFVIAFESGGPGADFNQDCFVDFFDYDDFVAAFEN